MNNKESIVYIRAAKSEDKSSTAGSFSSFKANEIWLSDRPIVIVHYAGHLDSSFIIDSSRQTPKS